MIAGGNQQFEKKPRSLGSAVLSREEIHGALYNALCRFFDKKDFFHCIRFEQMAWLMVTCFLCTGILGFSWLFFFGGNLVDSSAMLALNLEKPF
ncbi:hypothetical protein FAI41_03530 [Acetobacteraceae bacterium]|nr:hypothetical protein FAI41_03530 [Acetobacteraceae bacterium]